MTIKERFSAIRRKAQKQVTTDNLVDIFVDFLILVFDVLSSPILIVVRFFRYFMNKWVNGHIKRFLKWIVHKFV